MTVRETLLFSANLRLPESVSPKEKHQIVDKALQSLGLSHIANSRIGGNGIRGISGGEKRRVSIGVELVTSPSIIFLDEPTSGSVTSNPTGLDSYNAYMIISTLANLAHKEQKTIVFTIHQPRSDIYKLFDDVLVLAKGKTVYNDEGSQAAITMSMEGMLKNNSRISVSRWL